MLRRNINLSSWGTKPGRVDPDDAKYMSKGGGHFPRRGIGHSPVKGGDHIDGHDGGGGGGECGGFFGCPTWMLLLIALVLTAANWMIPGGGKNANDDLPHYLAQKAFEEEQILEQEMHAWLQSQGHGQTMPKIPDDGLTHDLNPASIAMQQQPSTWVDGEKKLKQQLKKLAHLQHVENKEIGVPVLTRWLPYDELRTIPAWAGSNVPDVEQWKQQVADQYVKMRQAETEWEQRVTAIINQNKQRG